MAVLTLGNRRVMEAKLWRHCGLLPLFLQSVRPHSFTPVSAVGDPDVAVPGGEMAGGDAATRGAIAAGISWQTSVSTGQVKTKVPVCSRVAPRKLELLTIVRMGHSRLGSRLQDLSSRGCSRLQDVIQVGTGITLHRSLACSLRSTALCRGCAQHPPSPDQPGKLGPGAIRSTGRSMSYMRLEASNGWNSTSRSMSLSPGR